MITESNILYLEVNEQPHRIEDVSALMDLVERMQISFAPWHGEMAMPKVDFCITYNENHIFLKFFVTEAAIKAEYVNFNDPVYEDSCVEFFIAFNGDSSYYNLEFNCMGTGRVQYGSGKYNRAFIPAGLIKTIQHQTTLKNTSRGDIYWELTLVVPKTVFMFHPQLNLENNRAKVNFFKCGDGLPQPHYLCWNNIVHHEPEFHLTDFFKQVTFSPQVV
ncbi:hypothetical protein FPZ42_02295 [Mucilaginibacter achroorhodeus]|uniref:Carbohydrate-binding domain-containing protein n=1 Tax=Mucilaginibacter achroorhodeus TaxID=2599294 RepID=A0A563U9S6_9SPHI|nr:carbohydrate-binding family 9-like protein [Mucilaginibacter achroorhodeus]TWR28066.1 hypothetical protein FPZ42_02295 [Mucilaginibacter achroorhodeus]